MKTSLKSLPMMILLLLCCQFTAQKLHAQHVSPSAINPLAVNSLDFIDAPLDQYRAQAEQAYRSGDFKKAAQYYLALLQHRSLDAVTLYNLACCYGRLNEPILAGQALKSAARAGMDVHELLSNDRDFSSVRNNEIFKSTAEWIAANHDERGDLTYLTIRKSVPCRIFLPPGHDKDKAIDLLLGLHGNGSSAVNFALISSLMLKKPFAFVAAQGAYPHPQAETAPFRSYTWTLPTSDKTTWAYSDPYTLMSIKEMIEELKSRMNIRRVFLMGFSQGGAIAYGTAFNYPELIDGLIVLGAQLPETGQPHSLFSNDQMKAASKLPVFIGHGEKDKAIPYRSALAAKKTLQDLGFPVTFSYFKGGHQITAEILNKAITWIQNISADATSVTNADP